MAAITPSPNLQISEQIADFFEFMLNQQRQQAPRLSPPQILATSIRQGMSAEIMASDMISLFPQIGIPNGTLGDGTTNVMEAFVKSFCDVIVDHIQQYARVDTAISAGISVTASGGNSGGPVVAQGASTSFGSGQSVIN
jgi:hypothetical protein